MRNIFVQLPAEKAVETAFCLHGLFWKLYGKREGGKDPLEGVRFFPEKRAGKNQAVLDKNPVFLKKSQNSRQKFGGERQQVVRSGENEESCMGSCTEISSWAGKTEGRRSMGEAAPLLGREKIGD